MALCKACRRIFEGHTNVEQLSARGVVYPPFLHHSYREQLEKAAFENCPICRKLWAISCRNPPRDQGDIAWLDDVPRVDPGYVSPQYSTRYNLFLGDHIAPATLNFMVMFGRDRPEPREPAEAYHSYTFEEFRLTRIPVDEKDDIPDGSRAESLPDLGAWTPSMKTAQEWLHRCLTKHERCKPSKSAQDMNVIPSRLLQIGSPSPEKIRLLVNPKQETDASRYATISHCWGNKASDTMQLTSKSASDLRQGIDISDLGQTFQDVILAARYLGIGYIWIDSLCIIQDSKDDWFEQSTLMSSVYMNSTINIAATAAPDSLAGCFPPRELPPAQSCVVQTAWDNFENSTFGIYSNDIWHVLRPDATNLPLLSRGWVLQETLLAPRMLHLAGKQALWQCRTVDACEEAAFGVPSSPFQYPPAAKWRAFGRSKGIDASTDAEGDHEARKRKASKQEERRYLAFWSKILRDYTGKAFTFHTDKLVGLSGVSKLMAGALGSDYFAGIWGRWMISDLCWNVTKRFCDVRPEDLPPRPSPYRAPSWSWACLEEPVVSDTTFHTSYDIGKRLPPVLANIIDSDTESESDTDEDFAASRAVARIIDCRVDSVTDDKMGALTGGTLRVIGRLATLEILPDWKDNHYYVFCNGSTWSYQLDDTTNSGDNVKITLDCKPPSLKFHCLPILVPSNSPICLLLLPTGTQKGQFSRYGTVEIYPNSLGLGESVFHDFLQIKNEDWLEFESRDEDGWCTLSIV